MAMKNPKTKEALLLILPCVVLATLALFLQFQPNVSSKLHQALFPKFTIVVDEVRFRRVSADNTGGEAYKVDIYINHHGPRPTWWDKGHAGTDLLNPHCVNKKGEKYHWHMYSGSFKYDKPSGRYFIECDTEVDKNFGASNGIFVAAVRIGNKAGMARFKVPVKEGSHRPTAAQ